MYLVAFKLLIVIVPLHICSMGELLKNVNVVKVDYIPYNSLPLYRL